MDVAKEDAHCCQEETMVLAAGQLMQPERKWLQILQEAVHRVG